MKKKRFQLQSESIVFLVFLFLSIVLLAFSGGSFISNFKHAGFSFISQTERALYSVSSFFGDTVSAVRELADLREKYVKAQEKLADYEILQRQTADIKVENEKLKNLLGFSESLSIKNIPAEIIAFDSSRLYSGIVINAGIKKGVKKDMSVVAFQNGQLGLVGKIVQVGRDTSIILPLYDYQSSVACKLEILGYRGITNGNGITDGVLTMQYVKKAAISEIQIGTKVLTSGFDDNSIFPKNIPVGTVTKIISHEYETSIHLELSPVVDFSSVEYVFVLDSTSGYEEIAQ
ncbi:MAG: rod shape-determining protein MreC [Treponemataceae bacterium]